MCAEGVARTGVVGQASGWETSGWLRSFQCKHGIVTPHSVIAPTAPTIAATTAVTATNKNKHNQQPQARSATKHRQNEQILNFRSHRFVLHFKVYLHPVLNAYK